MSSLNRATLIGRLGKDPEIRQTKNGGSVANFSLACNETWKDRETGEKREKTEWINVVVFSEGLIRVVEQYLKKGQLCYVEGKIQTRKWQDQQGQDRYSTEVVIQNFGGQIVLLGRDSDGGGGSSKPAAESNAYGSHRRAPAQAAAPAPSTLRDELDDQIPF